MPLKNPSLEGKQFYILIYIFPILVIWSVDTYVMCIVDTRKVFNMLQS